MPLKLVRQNSEQDLNYAKLDKEILFIKCKTCGYKYTASIGEMVDDPACKKCGK